MWDYSGKAPTEIQCLQLLALFFGLCFSRFPHEDSVLSHSSHPTLTQRSGQWGWGFGPFPGFGEAVFGVSAQPFSWPFWGFPGPFPGFGVSAQPRWGFPLGSRRQTPVPEPPLGAPRKGRQKLKRASSTLRSSQAVPHPSTDRALRRLTSEFGRDPVYSARYGR